MVKDVEKELASYRQKVAEFATVGDCEWELARLFADQTKTRARSEEVAETLNNAWKMAAEVQRHGAQKAAEVLGGFVGDAPEEVDQRGLMIERKNLALRLDIIERAVGIVRNKSEELWAEQNQNRFVDGWRRWLGLYAELVRVSMELDAMHEEARNNAGHRLPPARPLNQYLPEAARRISEDVRVAYGVTDNALERILSKYENRMERVRILEAERAALARVNH